VLECQALLVLKTPVKYCPLQHTGLYLVIVLIDLMQLVNAGNYNSAAVMCIELVTTAHTKPSQFVLINCCLATAYNNVDFSASVFSDSSQSQWHFATN
jgi:hypothetical protein